MSQDLLFSAGNVPIRLYAQEVAGAAPRAAILLLHGSGGSIDFWISRFGPALAQAGIHLYAPHYFERTGTIRADLATITDGVHVPQWLDTVEEAVRFVAARPGVDPSRIVLAGISLGGFLSIALAARQSAASSSDTAFIRAVISVSGGLAEPFARLVTSAFPPTLILHGAADTVVPVSEAHALDRRLTELDVAHRTEILPGEGHWFSPASLPRMLLAISGFLQEHLAASPVRAL